MNFNSFIWIPILFESKFSQYPIKRSPPGSTYLKLNSYHVNEKSLAKGRIFRVDFHYTNFNYINYMSSDKFVQTKSHCSISYFYQYDQINGNLFHSWNIRYAKAWTLYSNTLQIATNNISSRYIIFPNEEKFVRQRSENLRCKKFCDSKRSTRRDWNRVQRWPNHVTSLINENY